MKDCKDVDHPQIGAQVQNDPCGNPCRVLCGTGEMTLSFVQKHNDQE